MNFDISRHSEGVTTPQINSNDPDPRKPNPSPKSIPALSARVCRSKMMHISFGSTPLGNWKPDFWLSKRKCQKLVGWWSFDQKTHFWEQNLSTTTLINNKNLASNIWVLKITRVPTSYNSTPFLKIVPWRKWGRESGLGPPGPQWQVALVIFEETIHLVPRGMKQTHPET